jgi:hypothetical protein
MAIIFSSSRSEPGGGEGGRAGPVILAPSAPYRHGRWRWGGGYDGGGPAQHLFNRAERKHLHIYLQNDIKNIGLFMFRLWMARRGGGGGGESQDQLEVAAFIQQGREKTRMSSHILTV